MKKVFISILSLSITLLLMTSGEAKKKNVKVSPCVSKCRTENYKCRKLAKKAPVKDRKVKLKECRKIKKECAKKCSKPQSKKTSEQ